MRITSIIQPMKGKEKIYDNETAALVWTVTLSVEKVFFNFFNFLIREVNTMVDDASRVITGEVQEVEVSSYRDSTVQ